MPVRTSPDLLSSAAYFRNAAYETAREWRAMFARGKIASNLAAGLTVALIALPLNVALAIAAGLPPSVGLASGAVAGAIAALLGGSRFQITGPEIALAPITLEIATRHGLTGLAVATFFAGLFQVAFGLLRLGSIVHAIPLPVVGGFLLAVGLLVFNTQVPRLLGLPEQVESLAQFAADWANVRQVSVPALLVGLSVILLMVVLPRLHRRIPAPLVGLVMAVVCVGAFDLSLPTVEPMAAALPRPTLPQFHQVDLLLLLPEALALALLASIDSLLCAVSIDAVAGSERTRTDQELGAQGVANLASACFGGMPVAAAVVRSVAAFEAGASTRLAALAQAGCMLVMVLLAPLLSYVPLVALGAILLVVGFRLVQWRTLRALWGVARFEGLIFVGTAAFIVFTDFVVGVAIGVIGALARFAQQQRASLQARALHDEPGSAPADPDDGKLRLLRLEGPLFFGSQRSIEDAVSALHQASHVVIDLSAISTVDVSGATALATALRKLAARGVRVEVSTFGGDMDPLLRWAIDLHTDGEVLPLDPRREQAIFSRAERGEAAALTVAAEHLSA